MSLVLDASVALKLVLEEEGSDRMRALIEGADPLMAPDFLALEAANALAVMTRRNMMGGADVRAAMTFLQASPIRLLPSQPHYGEAFRLAVALGQSAYDCLYLALTLAERATMITADRRFAEAVQREPAYASAIRLL